MAGCRHPSRLVVLDTESGRVVAELHLSGDVDDIFLDEPRRRVYVSAGGGRIDVFVQRDADHYEALPGVASAAGARTALFVPEMDRLYLAVPRHPGGEAEIHIYAPQP